MSSSISQNKTLSILEAATKCRDAFLQCTACADLMKLEWAENRLADFNLWANGIGAFAGHRASVDDRLSHDPDTRNIIAHVLGLLQSCIQQCLSIANSSTIDSLARTSHGHDVGSLSPPEDLPRSFSPFSDESSDSEPASRPDDNVDDLTTFTSLMRDVEQLMNQLAKISLAIRNAGTTSRFRKADKLFHPGDYIDLRTYLENIVRSRPPGPLGVGLDGLRNDITPAQKRLVGANLRRRNRFVYFMRHAQKLAMATAPTSPVNIPLDPNRREDYRELASTIPHEPLDMKPRSIGRVPDLTETNASSLGTLPPLLPVKAPSSRVTMTQVTLTAAKVVYPKPPKVKAGLQQFKCPCCCQSLPLLYQENTHWNKSWQCLYCSTPGTVPRLFTTVEILTQHIRNSHADAVSDEHIAAVVRTALRPAPFGISVCPLCDTTGTSDSDMLFDHIAEHIHAFALQSLPCADDERCAKYFLENAYFDDESDNTQHDNVSGVSDRDSEGLPSLEDFVEDADMTTEIHEETTPQNEEETTDDLPLEWPLEIYQNKRPYPPARPGRSITVTYQVIRPSQSSQRGRRGLESSPGQEDWARGLDDFEPVEIH
ncbi:hypothetical protein PG999_014429 [Apiospora kogelbergensis]|uniref:C2H2-type domain-containing protein n=1 Tax=Apiospora kogelbergensis TaxID=1337665 RepID=A0AAW0Q3A6_9PEZI